MEDLILYKSILQDKNTKLQVILEYVSKKDFKITTDEIQHIENFSNKKNKLCKQILDIDESLKDLNIKELDEESLKIVSLNNNIIKKILQVDKKNNMRIQQITDIVKSNMKQLKKGSKVSKTYNSVYENYYAGNYFDKTK